MGANVAPDASDIPAPSAHIHQQEQSSDEESETESNYSADSDMCSTNSERYETEIVTDYNHEDSNPD